MTKYDLINHAGIVIDTADSMEQARYLYDYHLFGQRSLRIAERGKNTNEVLVTETSEGFNVTVRIGDFVESIEGLYDLDSALAFGRMHMSYQTNKYIRA